MFISKQSSTFIDYIIADVLRGTVSVYMKTAGNVAINRYAYKNVSRRAIANLIVNPNMSLGLWYNNNVLKPVRVQTAA